MSGNVESSTKSSGQPSFLKVGDEIGEGGPEVGVLREGNDCRRNRCS